MIINDSFPKFDLPIDFIADDSITGDILNYYSNFPCKIKAGVFVLCTEGMVKATINLLEVVIRKNDFVIVLPNSFIQIHEVSSDTRIHTLPHSLENKDIIRSILAIFLQGTKELYKRYGRKLDEPLRREQELYRQFIQLLMAHYTSEHEVAFYAEKVWSYCSAFL